MLHTFYPPTDGHPFK